MKLVLILIATGAIALSTFADLAMFRWFGGIAIDSNGEAIATGTATLVTILDTDLSANVINGTINLSVLHEAEATFHDASSLHVAPEILGGKFSTDTIHGDGSIVGSTAYALIVNRAGLTSLSQIQAGDYIGLSSYSHLIRDLQPNPEIPPYTFQAFDAGNVSIGTSVIPEPSTIGLMGIAGMGMILIRRKNCQPGHGPYGCRRREIQAVHRRWQSLEINQSLDLPGATAGHT